MDFVSIFGEGDESGIYTMRYNDVEEFDRLFKEWRDPIKLKAFFDEKQNLEDLLEGHKKGIFSQNTGNDAVIELMYQARELLKEFQRIAKIENPNEKLAEWLNLFKPLELKEVLVKDLQKNKVYGLSKKSYIRLYGLRLSDDSFIITGGSIKLTGKMHERDHTKEELKKLNKAIEYLKEEGIYEIGMD